MGERKNSMYYPPDYDPRKGGLNKSQGTHALRERANKLHLGILIIRFEMPYNIWCEGCGQHVGMGVRYNAEKTKVGMYYTTPVYQFRMKCTACPNHYVIKTDPGALDYEIVSGARRQERRWEASQNGQVVPDDKDTQKRLFDDAMFKLEHGEADVEKKKDAGPRMKDLAEIQDRVKDDYLANRILRDDFRVKKKADKAQKALDDALRKKASINISLVPEHKDDMATAALMKFQTSETSEERQSKKRSGIEVESIFRARATKIFKGSKESRSSKKEKSKKNLVGLFNQHKMKTVIERTTGNPLRNIGVVLKRAKKEEVEEYDSPCTSTSSMSEPLPSTSSAVKTDECSTAETQSPVVAAAAAGLGSLCDYGSTSPSSPESDNN
jgi:coiled-coil domain-containing protein 130